MLPSTLVRTQAHFLVRLWGNLPRDRQSFLSLVCCLASYPGHKKTAWEPLLTHARSSPKSGEFAYSCILSVIRRCNPPFSIVYVVRPYWNSRRMLAIRIAVRREKLPRVRSMAFTPRSCFGSKLVKYRWHCW